MSGMGNSPNKQVARGGVDHNLGNVEAAFVVAYEATVVCHLAEAALDHPSPWQHFESGFGVEAAYDLDNEVDSRRRLTLLVTKI